MSEPKKPKLVSEARRVLDNYLRTISFRSEVYYRSQVCEDWNLGTSSSGHINVQVVCHGDRWFRLPGLYGMQQQFDGDVVVLPHDASHPLLSAPGLPAQ
jgi:hypothetical protein